MVVGRRVSVKRGKNICTKGQEAKSRENPVTL